MRNLVIVIAFFSTTIAFAQEVDKESSLLDEMTATLTDDMTLAKDTEEITVFVREYVDVFNAKSSKKLAQNIFMPTAQITTFTLSTTAEIESMFELIYADMEPNWDHTIINIIDVCLAKPGLAFDDLNYSRSDKNGKPIQPVERASLLIIRKSDEHWPFTRMMQPDKLLARTSQVAR